jgi:flagellar biosynthesis chaperone FliJ
MTKRTEIIRIRINIWKKVNERERTKYREDINLKDMKKV